MCIRDRFGLEYKNYADEWNEIFETETSDRAFEEEVMLAGFSNAAVKPEGQGVTFDDAQETFTARYTNETIALAFAITEEAIEDNFNRALKMEVVEDFIWENYFT